MRKRIKAETKDKDGYGKTGGKERNHEFSARAVSALILFSVFILSS
jgi:hypothetical protein